MSDKWVKIQALLMGVLVVVTTFYAIHTYSLVKVTRQQAQATEQMAEEAERQREMIMGLNRPILTVEIKEVEYITSGLLPPNWSEPEALAVSITNEGERSALGLTAYVLGKGYEIERIPYQGVLPPVQFFPIPQYSSWSEEQFHRKQLKPKEEVEVKFEKEPQFIFIEETEKLPYAQYVPFPFALVVICEDDFGRVWLSVRELEYELIRDTYRLDIVINKDEGAQLVFEVPSKD